MATFLLGSASPRRREILRTLGLTFEVSAVDADESERPGEAPDDYLVRVVAAKLTLAAERARGLGLDAVVVADTTVVLDHRMLAKPSDRADNRAMVAALAGREHEVKTRFAVRGPLGDDARTVTTRVRFRALTDAEIDGYAASGEGLDKAGGYAIQGLGSFMVEAIVGSYSAVVGLPACEVAQALVTTGVIAGLPVSPR